MTIFRHRCAAIVIILATPVLALASGTSATGAVPTVIGHWNMNEAPGSTVLVDSSGHGFNGAIGAAVKPNGTSQFFDLRSHKSGTPVTPEHLDTVPSSPGLNPGSADYSVTLRLRWAAPLPDVNLVQKGQGSAHGWKIESSKAHVRCQFIGSLGQATVKSIDYTNHTWADGNWHTVTCSRTASAVSLTIDGVLIGTTHHVTGDITNTWPVSIAGKTQCNNVTIWCDYWSGDIDYISITSP